MEMHKFWEVHKEVIIVLAVLAIAFVFLNGGINTLGGVSSQSIGSKQLLAVEESYGFASDVDFARSASSGYYPPSGVEHGDFGDEERREKKTATIRLETKNYAQDKSKIVNVMNKYNGFYTNQDESSSTYGDNSYRTYTYTFKVPIESFDLAINDLKEIGELKNMYINADDLTSQYVDVEARLNSKIQLRTRVLQLLNQAETIEEIIQVEDRLANLQREIDSYQRQLTNIERQTDYSQISVTLQEKLPAAEAFYRFTGFSQLLRNVVKSFDSVLVVFSSLLGWVVFILVLFGIYKGIRKVFS